MTSVRNQIQQMDEYSPPGQSGQSGSGQPAGPVESTVGPVVSMEKTDIEFWAQVGQFILLLLIWRELRGGGL